MTVYTSDTVPPGSWQRFADHFPRAVTPEFFRLYQSTFEPNQAAVYENYGVPFRGLRTALIGGHVYLAPVPLVGTMGSPVPPKPVLWAATRILPEFRRRNRRARAVLRERPWLDEVHEWRHETRPLWIQANLALQREDLGSFDDAGLATHLRRCQANAEEGYRLHFRLHGPDLLATGLLLARGDDWGLSARELLDTLVGSSPASTGLDADLLLIRARVANAAEQPKTPDDVRAIGPDVAAALDRYLEHHGSRIVTSYDLDGRCLDELPSLVVALASEPPDRPRPAIDVDALRSRVPAKERAEFDRLLTDARFTFGLRDENGPLTGAWPIGLVRRAMLEVGRRLADRGRLAEPEHAVEVTIDELLELLADKSGLTAGGVAARAAGRIEASRTPPPDALGRPIPGRQAITAFPKALRLMVRAQLALFENSIHRGAEPLAGLGIGTVPVTARACVASDATDALAKLQPGEILVTASTSPAFNAALSIAGGLVVEEGGHLSHAAIIARELGLPAIVGVAGATAQIPDEALVEVDPDAGVARILSPI